MNNLYFAEFPLEPNEELTAIVGTEGRAVFDFVDTEVDVVFAHRICAKLNGEAGVYFAHEWTSQDDSLAYDGHRVLDISGWHRLIEMYGLRGREADWEQEEFLLWCADVLNSEP